MRGFHVAVKDSPPLRNVDPEPSLGESCLGVSMSIRTEEVEGSDTSRDNHRRLDGNAVGSWSAELLMCWYDESADRSCNRLQERRGIRTVEGVRR